MTTPPQSAGRSLIGRLSRTFSTPRFCFTSKMKKVSICISFAVTFGPPCTCMAWLTWSGPLRRQPHTRQKKRRKKIVRRCRCLWLTLRRVCKWGRVATLGSGCSRKAVVKVLSNFNSSSPTSSRSVLVAAPARRRRYDRMDRATPRHPTPHHATTPRRASAC